MRCSKHRIQELEAHAAKMRRAPTVSEARLFEAMRGGRLGVGVRRQVPLAGRFIADFFVSEVKLVVEVDGGYHRGRAEADAKRDRAHARLGVSVLRLDAVLVLDDLPAAVAVIEAEIARLRRA
jgi:adenine-specific DNA-methyltransferase